MSQRNARSHAGHTTAPVNSATSLHGRVRSAMSLALALLILCSGLPGTLRASEEWQTASGNSLTVLMQPNSRLAASSFLDAYGAFAEIAIEEISLLLDQPGPSRPIILQVFSEGHVYDAAVSDLGRVEIEDIIAVADPARSTVLIPLSKFIALVPFDAQNQLRHAISHILVHQATEGAVPRGFDEGFARYVERPLQPKLARIASIVQGADLDGTLISWSNMNRATPLDDHELIESQAYAVLSFLLQNHGLARFQSFLEELAAAETWRDAMNVAYAPATSDSLERQWR
ncbi:MAG: hypothetical protein AB7G88_16060, partial [Thermomicrobiales bacterium]